MKKQPSFEEYKLGKSIVGFNGTSWGKKCLTGEQLLRSWLKAKKQRGQVELLSFYKKNKHYSQWLAIKLKGK